MKYRPDPYTVDILIRGHNNLDKTHQLLTSIFENTPSPRFNVTYVDNASTDKRYLQDLISSFSFPGVDFVLLPYNAGSVRAINIGLQLALLSDSKFILLMDNDAEVPSGDTDWLDRFITYFDDPTIGAAGAVCNRVAGYQHCEQQENLYMKDWEVGDEKGFKEPQAVPVLVSYAMMLRKDAVRQVGLFDERYEPGNFEDFDYALSLHFAGWKNVIASSVWVHHHMHSTFQSMGLSDLLETNQMKWIDKWTPEKLVELGLLQRVA